MNKQDWTPFDWQLLFFWLVATSMGWALGQVLLPGLQLVLTGLAIAIFQWLVLQHRIRNSLHWLAASVIGWTAGGVFNLLAVPIELEFLLTGLVFGLATGLAQWLVLRLEVRWAGWWLIIMPLAWAAGLSVFPGILLSGVMAGLITGIALELLLRNPKPVQKETPNGDASG